LSVRGSVSTKLPMPKNPQLIEQLDICCNVQCDIDYISSFSNLKSLVLHDGMFSDEELTAIQTALPECVINEYLA
ncbi:MAG: hypothetical protein IJ385_06620, partial [Ruminiclostridium sp.]|nr:hypothetical protein [Ruminiclostridium sp.]